MRSVDTTLIGCWKCKMVNNGICGKCMSTMCQYDAENYTHMQWLAKPCRRGGRQVCCRNRRRTRQGVNFVTSNGRRWHLRGVPDGVMLVPCWSRADTFASVLHYADTVVAIGNGYPLCRPPINMIFSSAKSSYCIHSGAGQGEFFHYISGKCERIRTKLGRKKLRHKGNP